MFPSIYDLQNLSRQRSKDLQREAENERLAKRVRQAEHDRRANLVRKTQYESQRNSSPLWARIWSLF